MKRISRNNEGQTSLDFLIGITLFLLVFIFVFAFIPKMFTPFQTDSDELTMTADRVAMALVENLLIEDQHVDDHSGQPPAYTGADNPGIINGQKCTSLKDRLTNPASPDYNPVNVKKALGLGYFKSYGKNAASPDDQLYKIQIELRKVQSDGTVVSEMISPDGEPVGSNVGQSKRFVYVHDPMNLDPDQAYTMSILIVRVW